LPKFIKKPNIISNEMIMELLDNSNFMSLAKESSRGTLIQALDDEFHIVRESAIEAIENIGSQIDEFAQKSIKFLLGMLNDEADETRIIAVKALRKISKGTKLSVFL